METRFDLVEEYLSSISSVVIGPSFWYEIFGFKFNDFGLTAPDAVKARENLFGPDSLLTDEEKVKGSSIKLKDKNILIYIPSPREQKLYGITFYPSWWKSNIKGCHEIVDLDSLYNINFSEKDSEISGGWYLFRREQCFNGMFFEDQVKLTFSFKDVKLQIMNIRRFLILLFLTHLHGSDCCIGEYNIRLNDLINPFTSWAAKKNGDGRFTFYQYGKNKSLYNLGVACFRPLI